MVYTPEPVEVLRTPEYMLQAIVSRGFFNGDCDDAAILVAAISKGMGIPCKLVAISEGILSDDYVHVFVEMLYNNQWVIVDPTIAPGTPILTLNALKVLV